jgi:hypothetical protein
VQETSTTIPRKTSPNFRFPWRYRRFWLRYPQFTILDGKYTGFKASRAHCGPIRIAQMRLAPLAFQTQGIFRAYTGTHGLRCISCKKGDLVPTEFRFVVSDEGSPIASYIADWATHLDAFSRSRLKTMSGFARPTDSLRTA